MQGAALVGSLWCIACTGLAARVGGLGAELEWAHVLSLGEQQRVAFARLLGHGPRLAFLDEATGALDGPTEAALYTALAAQAPAYVSVGAMRNAPPPRSRRFIAFPFQNNRSHLQ